MNPKFSNGDAVRDRVTGLKGIVTSVTTYFNGCIRYTVQPQEIKDGKPVEGTFFDQGDLELVKAAKIASVAPRETGGPQRGENRMPKR